MREGAFELRVMGARVTREEDVVRLEPGQTFTLEVVNHSASHSEMALKINGQDMGLFDLPAGQTIRLLEGERGPFRYSAESPSETTDFTPANGWIMALFLPLSAKRNFTVLPSPVLGPKLAHRANLARNDVEDSTCLELFLEGELEGMRLASEGEKPGPSVRTVGAPAVERLQEDEPHPAQVELPQVSAEALVRYRLLLRRALLEYLFLASGLTNDELELALAQLTDRFLAAANGSDRAVVRLRLIVVQHYYQARQAGKQPRRWLPLIRACLSLSFHRTLGEILVLRMSKHTLPVHPADPATLPTDEELRQMVDALAP